MKPKYKHEYTYDRGWDDTVKTFLVHSSRPRKTNPLAKDVEIDFSVSLPTKQEIGEKIAKAKGKEDDYLSVFQAMKGDPDAPKKMKISVDKTLETSREPDLSETVKAQFPGKNFRMSCQGQVLKFSFEKALTGIEIGQLNQLVLNAKTQEQLRITMGQ